MTAVNPALAPGHIPYLIDMANRRMQQDLGVLVNRRRFPELRGSHFRILSMIPPPGSRPSALAAAAAMTRPALGELVGHLRQNGYVEVNADASDGRAVLVQLTRRGRQAVAEAERAIGTLRQRWAEEIGEPRMDAMIDALTALAAPMIERGDAVDEGDP